MSFDGMKRILLGSWLVILFAMWASWVVGASHPVEVGVISWCALSTMLWLTSVGWLKFENAPCWRAWRARRQQQLNFSRARVHK